MQLYQGTEASSSFGVSIFNQNCSHMTIAIKKSAHITLYNHRRSAILPSDCTIGNRSEVARNFIDLPYNADLCILLNSVLTNSSYRIIQEAGQNFSSNFVMDTVYTVQKGLVFENGDAVMLDFSTFQAYNMKGSLPTNKEYMVAYSSNSLKYENTTDNIVAADLSNDKIGTILKKIDPSYFDQNAWDIMAGMTTIRARWENGDYSDIALNQSQVMDAIQTPTWWISTVSTLALLFLIPHIGRLIVRRIPEYAENLRNLLLLTIERSKDFDGIKKINHVGIVLHEKDNQTDRQALLSVNGYPVSVAEELISAETSLIVEESVDTT